MEDFKHQKEEDIRHVLALSDGGRCRVEQKQAKGGGPWKQESRFQMVVDEFKSQKEEDTIAKCKNFKGKMRKQKQEHITVIHSVAKKNLGIARIVTALFLEIKNNTLTVYLILLNIYADMRRCEEVEHI